MKKFLQFLSYVLVAALASCLTMVLFIQREEQKQSKLDQLLDIIDKCYIGESDQTALEDAAAAAIVDATGDRWGYYISAADYQSHLERQKNAYVGIGITIQLREDELGYDVVEVSKGGPAQEAGLQVKDVLTKVEGQNVVELGLDGTKALIQGDEGTFVNLTVTRDGRELSFSVERRQVLVEVVSYRMLEDNIGYIQLENFHERCAADSIAAIEDLRDQGAVAIVFDVRNNGGGFKSELVDLLDYLLPEGPLFRSEDYTGKKTVDESDASYLDMPMAVMVNGSSYSAAEFFAAALSEYDAAVIVGDPTTGKGHFQLTYLLNDNSAVNLSVGRYTTPNGENLDGVGITPDIVVEVDEETAANIYYGLLEPADDPQIQAAVDALKNP